MKNAKTLISAKAIQAVKSIASSFNSVIETKRYINHDGTVAENHNTYKEFRQDIIKSSGFGW